MASKSISGKQTESLLIKKSGTYTIEKNATIIAGGSAGFGSGGAIMDATPGSPANNVKLNIEGKVIGGLAGIALMGAHDVVTLGKTAQVTGLYGVALGGDGSRAINNSHMLGTSLYGMVAADGDHVVLQNNGTILSAAGLYALSTANDVVMLNSKGASIVGMQAAMYVATTTGQTSTFINHGSLSVTYDAGSAILGADGDEKVINDGAISGGIFLGDGNDTIDTRGGTIKGLIETGDDDDVLITDSAKHKLTEDVAGGDDTVKSTVSYVLSDNVENLILLGSKDINGTGSAQDNVLTGNSGDNVLKGLAGVDTLFGGKGSDKLYGGDGADTFHFSTGDGKDRIMDFVGGEDTVDLTGWTQISAANISQHIQDVTGGILITYDGSKDSLFIAGMDVATFDASDFNFAPAI